MKAYLTLWLFSFHFRVVVLESRPTDNPTANSNLYILAGHENSYWDQCTAGSSPRQENTPAAAAFVAGWNCTKTAVTRLQLLYNLLWHERKRRLFVVWTHKHHDSTEVLNLLLCNLCTYAVFFSETSCWRPTPSVDSGPPVKYKCLTCTDVKSHWGCKNEIGVLF